MSLCPPLPGPRASGDVREIEARKGIRLELLTKRGSGLPGKLGQLVMGVLKQRGHPAPTQAQICGLGPATPH